MLFQTKDLDNNRWRAASSVPQFTRLHKAVHSEVFPRKAIHSEFFRTSDFPALNPKASEHTQISLQTEGKEAFPAETGIVEVGFESQFFSGSGGYRGECSSDWAFGGCDAETEGTQFEGGLEWHARQENAGVGQ